MYPKSESTAKVESRIAAAKDKIKNPVKAIRAKCIDCTGAEPNAVKKCELIDCPLFPFRFGKNPFRGKSKPDNYLPPIKAIRAECLSCNYTAQEVRLCPCTECALYPLRLDVNVYATESKREAGQKSILTLKKRPSEHDSASNSDQTYCERLEP